MKAIRLISIIAAFLLLYTDGLQSQTTTKKLNQVELMEQLLGTWKGELAIDTIMLMNWTSYGKAIEDNYKIVSIPEYSVQLIPE